MPLNMCRYEYLVLIWTGICKFALDNLSRELGIKTSVYFQIEVNNTANYSVYYEMDKYYLYLAHTEEMYFRLYILIST